MEEKIISRPLSEEGRATWDRVFAAHAHARRIKMKSCPKCKGRATKIINISNGTVECQQCNYIYESTNEIKIMQQQLNRVVNEMIDNRKLQLHRFNEEMGRAIEEELIEVISGPAEVQVVQHEDRQVRAPGDPEEPKGDTGRGSTGED